MSYWFKGIDFVAVKKISISLPRGLYNALAQWAMKEDTNPTSLATDLVSALIRKEVTEGRVTLEQTTDETPPELKAFLNQLAFGELPTNGQLVTFAHDLGVPTEVLMQIRERIQKGSKQEGH